MFFKHQSKKLDRKSNECLKSVMEDNLSLSPLEQMNWKMAFQETNRNRTNQKEPIRTRRGKNPKQTKNPINQAAKKPRMLLFPSNFIKNMLQHGPLAPEVQTEFRQRWPLQHQPFSSEMNVRVARCKTGMSQKMWIQMQKKE